MGKENMFGFQIASLMLINCVGNARFSNNFLYFIGLETKKNIYNKIQIYTYNSKLGKEEVKKL